MPARWRDFPSKEKRSALRSEDFASRLNVSIFLSGQSRSPGVN
jgi:hypothetical protein